jgi:hypothetical protein
MSPGRRRRPRRDDAARELHEKLDARIAAVSAIPFIDVEETISTSRRLRRGGRTRDTGVPSAGARPGALVEIDAAPALLDSPTVSGSSTRPTNPCSRPEAVSLRDFAGPRRRRVRRARARLLRRLRELVSARPVRPAGMQDGVIDGDDDDPFPPMKPSRRTRFLRRRSARRLCARSWPSSSRSSSGRRASPARSPRRPRRRLWRDGDRFEEDAPVPGFRPRTSRAGRSPRSSTWSSEPVAGTRRRHRRAGRPRSRLRGAPAGRRDERSRRGR